MSAKALLIIDVQEKLIPAIDKDIFGSFLENTKKMIQFAQLLNFELIVTEQYPKGLGPTIRPLKEVIGDGSIVVEKTAFSAFGELEFSNLVKRDEVLHLYIVGMESHVCVYQTALDAIRQNFQVTVLEDCVCGRKSLDHKNAMLLLRSAGVKVSTFEMAAMELVKGSRHECFKELSNLLKE